MPAKTVWVGAPVISSISGPTSTPNNQWATYTAQLQSALSAPTAYNWILNPLNGNSVYYYGSTCDIAFYNSGTYQLVVQAIIGTDIYYRQTCRSALSQLRVPSFPKRDGTFFCSNQLCFLICLHEYL